MMYLLGITGNGLVDFLIVLLIICVILYALKLVFAEFGVGGNIAKLIYLIFAVVALVYLWKKFGGAL